ncbi:SPOR domain-containing protein [Cellulophaga sp. HaHaR_3_176]|uniref:HU domain-containing protein n=1 Tax=Cellulophaga sp. HaHaR_3_176 TaxID=1942464 RepID=UPI00352F9A5B
MMRLEHYIEELLYRYNCVIVPEFGAFLTQNKSAYIKDDTHTFYPPSKVLSFNKLLVSNDGLLVSYIADAEKTTYDDVLQRLAVLTKKWEKQLQNSERLVLDNIGEFWIGKEGKLLFEPSKRVNYLTTSFGLSSCVSSEITREILKDQIVELEEEIPFIITPEQREKKSFRPFLKYAAVAFLTLSLGLTGFRYYTENNSNQVLAHQDAQKEVSRHIEEATFFDAAPLELPALNIKATIINNSSETTYHVVAGAFKVKDNADKKINQLKSEGFNANYIGINKFGFHVVSFDSFTEVNEALNYLRTIKRTKSSDAWMFQE